MKNYFTSESRSMRIFSSMGNYLFILIPFLLMSFTSVSAPTVEKDATSQSSASNRPIVHYAIDVAGEFWKVEFTGHENNTSVEIGVGRNNIGTVTFTYVAFTDCYATFYLCRNGEVEASFDLGFCQAGILNTQSVYLNLTSPTESNDVFTFLLE